MIKKLLLLLVFLPCSIFAQTMSGVVSDEISGPLPGVNILVKGTSNGTATDFDGNYTLSNLKKGDVVVFTFMGYKSFSVAYNGQKTQDVVLQEDAAQLDEIVVVGYGSVKKKDATGSVVSVTAKDFNKGQVVSADQMVQGKVAGLQISNGGGAPGEGSQVRIRSGSSVSSSNDPLYVIDGVPIELGGQGGRNPLASINQNDIETVTVLKDASATAIYGSRASNGVIMITTKKGKAGELSVSYNGNVSSGFAKKYVNVLSGDQFRSYVNQNIPSKSGALGTANTDWQKEIYRDFALGTDHNVVLTGGNAGTTYRTSLGYTDLNGLLQRDNFKRTTFSAGVTQYLLDESLRIEFNNRTSMMHNDYSNGGAIGASVSYDPTQPVKNADGSYHQWPISENLAGANPVSLIYQFDNYGRAFNSMGNVKFDYKLPFLKELTAVLNLGYDYKGGVNTSSTRDDWYKVQDTINKSYSSSNNKNRLLDFYLNYKKEIGKINLDVMGGYSYQNFQNDWYSNYINNKDKDLPANERENRGRDQVNLQSIFARANIGFYDKYLITLSMRRDGTSRFVGDVSPFSSGDGELKFATFPAAAFAWKIKDESFLKNVKSVSDLKLRLGWGITGQQNVGSKYPSTPTYNVSQVSDQYIFGNTVVGTIRPNSYNAALKWEETTTYNAGIDYGLFNNKLTGTIDYYKRRTDDLLFYVTNPVGVAFNNANNYNTGSLNNYGVELMANVAVIENDTYSWNVGGNWTYQHSNIEKIFSGADASFPGIASGGISGGTGNTIQNLQAGFAPHSFYVFEQKYDASGKPLEGVYVDRNKDGVINNQDLYRFRKPASDFFYGFNTSVTYKAWDFSMQWRGSVNNYIYNNVQSQRGNSFEASPVGEFVNNVNGNATETGFIRPQYLSDYYVQNASFLRWDNVSLGYTIDKPFKFMSNMKLSGTVQNVLVITKYKGLDPEVNGGIDNTIYPRPITYMLGVNVNF